MVVGGPLTVNRQQCIGVWGGTICRPAWTDVAVGKGMVSPVGCLRVGVWLVSGVCVW